MKSKVLIIVVMILSMSSISHAAQPIDLVPVSQLIDEIRLLRTSLQQALSLQSRSHLLLEQIRLQQDVINNHNQILESSRDEAATHARQKVDYEEQAKELETRLTAVMDPKEQSAVKDELRGIRKAQEQSNQLESRYKSKEYESQAALVKEEARMAELNKNLESFSAYFASLAQ
ncbi:MAG: hypothetical protein WCP20_16805 [Desulfuromonadales bacterium]